MEKAKKNLRDYSFLALLFAALSLVRIIYSATTGGLEVDTSSLPEGITEAMVQIVLIVVLALSVVLLLPQLYIGVKGMKVAKNPDASKGHIVWAKILLVLSIIAIISPVVDIFKDFSVDRLLEIIDIGIDVILFFAIVKYGNQVRKAVK